MVCEWLVVKFRSLLQKIHAPQRLDSYPYISGDAYRIRCSVDLTKNDFSSLKTLNKDSFETVFVPVGRFGPLLEWLAQEDLVFEKWNLVIHNGDFRPISSEMENISSKFRKIYAVNWLGDQSIASSIPIGIENRSFRRNGMPNDFKLINFLNKFSFKKFLLAIAFKAENNLSERGSLTSKFCNLPGVIIPDKPLLPFSYKKLLGDSRFVLSPPGNGVDCHRTWEAIYLGSIPVVLKRAWPFAHVDLPVLVTDQWDDVLELISESSYFLKVTHIEIWDLFMKSPFQMSEESK